MHGVSVFLEGPQSTLLSALHHVGTQQSDGHVESWISADFECVGATILDFPAPRTTRNRCLLFASPQPVVLGHSHLTTQDSGHSHRVVPGGGEERMKSSHIQKMVNSSV